MSVYEIKIDAKNALAGLARVEHGTQDMSPLASGISMEFLHHTGANLEAEGRPKWLGLAPSTIKARAKKGKWPGKIMQVSGQLAASFTPGHDADSAWIGSNKKYAAIQHAGGDINKAAQSRLVRHRTDAQGNLLRTGRFGGKGLVFAKDSHKRAVARWFEQGAHTIHIPARPSIPADAQGNLQPEAETSILGLANNYLANLIGG